MKVRTQLWSTTGAEQLTFHRKMLPVGDMSDLISDYAGKQKGGNKKMNKELMGALDDARKYYKEILLMPLEQSLIQDKNHFES